MNKNKIGLNATQIKDGLEVYFYNWLDKESGNHSSGMLSTIIGDVFYNSNGYCCFISSVSGYVLISHLSFDYYPESYVKKSKSKRKYEDYLRADCCESFPEWLGIDRPKYQTNYITGCVRLFSVKYSHIKSDYFKYKKDAYKDYKEKLKAYLKSLKR